jgi:hypothetical protein
MTQTEIDLPEGARLKPLGRVAKRTRRQRFLLDLGYHPLAPVVRYRVLRTRVDAPPPGDRKAPGPRCGSCKWLGPLYEGAPGKRCWINNGERVTSGSATEVRAWWPACEEFTQAGT